MANTINNGISQSLAYYPATGTDVDDAGANLKWNPTTNQVTLVGRLQVSKNIASNTDTSLSLVHYGSTFVPIYISRSLGTSTTPSKVTAGYTLGGISFTGRANTVFKTGAYINAVVDGVVSDTSMPSKIVFGTHNGSTLAVRAELSKLGELKVNTIKNFSGGDLTLSPDGRVVINVNKLNITGGSPGQILSINNGGVLAWTTPSISSYTDNNARRSINGGVGISYNSNTGFIHASNIPNSSLQNNSIIINGNTVPLGGSYNYEQDILNTDLIKIGTSTTAEISSVSIGKNAVSKTTGGNSYTGYYKSSVAIGESASAESGSVAIGPYAGMLSRQNPTTGGIAITTNSVSIGYKANYENTLFNLSHNVAIGYQAASKNQQPGAVAIGSYAGSNSQGENSVAIGNKAGGGYIGYRAITQAANSIIINASGTPLESSNNGFYVSPIRTDIPDGSSIIMYYDPTSKEVKYGSYQISSAPTTSRGFSWHVKGMFFSDDNYYYYCNDNYDGEKEIWKRVPWSNDTW